MAVLIAGEGLDPAVAIGIYFAVASGFFAVVVNYYFRLTRAGERLVIRRTRKRLRQSRRFRRIRHVGLVLWAIDVTVVLGLRATVGVYVAFVWFVLVPLMMTIGSLTLAASIISLCTP